MIVNVGIALEGIVVVQVVEQASVHLEYDLRTRALWHASVEAEVSQAVRTPAGAQAGKAPVQVG